ncbi:hypothetical protein BJ508DRAFT_371533 [Ascobolus immersus RN42]|uniref:Uncharacterized protein n=1 Tax=Ascobolus immersus RN42 TaxID=1160509 RepID=A0A3N4IV16_ASCIM|nr:hypothetical protein BJ508DRAFT_371533 [Ascobolus immersus RN42]
MQSLLNLVREKANTLIVKAYDAVAEAQAKLDAQKAGETGAEGKARVDGEAGVESDAEAEGTTSHPPPSTLRLEANLAVSAAQESSNPISEDQLEDVDSQQNPDELPVSDPPLPPPPPPPTPAEPKRKKKKTKKPKKTREFQVEVPALMAQEAAERAAAEQAAAELAAALAQQAAAEQAAAELRAAEERAAAERAAAEQAAAEQAAAERAAAEQAAREQEEQVVEESQEPREPLRFDADFDYEEEVKTLVQVDEEEEKRRLLRERKKEQKKRSRVKKRMANNGEAVESSTQDGGSTQNGGGSSQDGDESQDGDAPPAEVVTTVQIQPVLKVQPVELPKIEQPTTQTAAHSPQPPTEWKEKKGTLKLKKPEPEPTPEPESTTTALERKYQKKKLRKEFQRLLEQAAIPPTKLIVNHIPAAAGISYGAPKTNNTQPDTPADWDHQWTNTRKEHIPFISSVRKIRPGIWKPTYTYPPEPKCCHTGKWEQLQEAKVTRLAQFQCWVCKRGRVLDKYEEEYRVALEEILIGKALAKERGEVDEVEELNGEADEQLHRENGEKNAQVDGKAVEAVIQVNGINEADSEEHVDGEVNLEEHNGEADEQLHREAGENMVNGINGTHESESGSPYGTEFNGEENVSEEELVPPFNPKLLEEVWKDYQRFDILKCSVCEVEACARCRTWKLL